MLGLLMLGLQARLQGLLILHTKELAISAI